MKTRELPSKIIYSIKLFLEPLIMSDGFENNSEVQREAEAIEKMQDNDKINKLVEKMEKVNISLKDAEPIVKKAKVSENKAKEKAEEVVKNKSKDTQKTR